MKIYIPVEFFSVFLAVVLFSSCDKKTPFDYVDPFIGTGGHGHTFPGATHPFGMVQLSPDTRLTGWDGCSGYHFSDSIVYGFSHTHLSGTGISDYGDVLLMPFSGDIHLNNGADGEAGYRSRFSKETEQAQAGYYSMELLDDQILAELTTTPRVGFHRYTYKNPQDRKLIIDLTHRDQLLESKLEQVDEFTLSGYRHSKAWAQKQYLFFHIAFDQPIMDLIYDDAGEKAAIVFDSGKQLKVKVSLSAVDEEGARANMNEEVAHWDFDQVRQDARHTWEKQLSKIQVSGGSDQQLTVFYTSLYHTMMAPNLYEDVNGRFRSTDLGVHQDSSFTNYTVFSLWDTYRSTHPLYTLIEGKRTSDFINTFLHQYQVGGRLPMWELAGNYTDCMIGYHSVAVISDSYIKGVREFDENLALEAMIHSASQERLGIYEFRTHGYIPSDAEAESVSKTLEYAYDDWTIAQMANQMGRPEVAAEFYQRAQHYKNVFDPETGFMRARNNNRWFYPFEPAEVNFNYTEANAWQYSYYVPQDVEGWIQLLGGDAQAEAKLDAIFAASSESRGREQADITGLIGQYAHGNEPSHHIAYLYNYVGRPDKTQKLVRQIMNELYSDQPDGLSGNEDCGQMSSWLVMSAMGFYPVAPGSADYVLGSPWFDKVVLHLENGNQFVIEARNNSDEHIFISSAKLNHEAYPYSYLSHRSIMEGGLLIFQMAKEPSRFGIEKPDRPVSRIENELVAIPALQSGDRAFMDSTLVSLSCATSDAVIYYSLSESEIAVRYEAPFAIYDSEKLTVWAEKDGAESLRSSSEFFKIPTKRNIILETEYATHYTAGGDQALIDFIRGGEDFRTGAWQGYEGVDLEAIVDLGSKTNISTVQVGFLQDENAWIFMPLEVEFFISEDGERFSLVETVKNDISYKKKGSFIKDFLVHEPPSGRYVKVVARNRGVCPPDHKGAGGKSWIFADEIVIE